MANGDCLPVDCFASHFVDSRVRGNDGWIRSFALLSITLDKIDNSESSRLF